jgi:hypothetical protein
MKTVNYFGSISGMVAAAALALAGCAELTTPTATSGPATATPQAVGAISARPGLGVVRAIEAVQQEVAGIGGTAWGLAPLWVVSWAASSVSRWGGVQARPRQPCWVLQLAPTLATSWKKGTSNKRRRTESRCEWAIAAHKR